jgi:c(7)-type cytochrome triheme protein
MTAKRAKMGLWSFVFVALVAVGLYATFRRYTLGLGAATNLSDRFPWGIWIGFDLLVGVALAGGGFTTAATVHVFKLEKYEPIARPAVLTAFLGYVLVVVALLFDLGRPWDIWHPLIMWNTHSVMFEVAWCVMLYTTVLFFEFVPAVLERLGWQKPLKLVKAVYVPLVIAGCLLSLMHQSSLGTLYLIASEKLHGLWYSPLLPVFFFLTSVSGGLSMVIVESSLSYRAFGKELEESLLRGIARVVVVFLAVYAVLKLEDLASRGNLRLVFELTPEAVMFWGETGLGVLLPMVLFSIKRVRHSRQGLFFGAMLTVLGLIVGRLNVAITGMARSAGVNYWPNWQEYAVSTMLVAIGMVAFGVAVKYLHIFERRARRRPVVDPERSWSRVPMANGWGLACLWLLLGIGAALFVIADKREAAAKAPAPVATAPTLRHLERLRLPADYRFPASDSPGEVVFSHANHVNEEAPDCGVCHAADWSLQAPGQPLRGKLTHEQMDQGALCGSCHNGKTSSISTTSDCDDCHHS